MRRIVLACLLASAATPALADKIDGDWCFADGRHFSIDGPTIVTERGRTLAGDYRRHFFAYVIPPPEAQAGVAVEMALADENTVYLRVGRDGPTETWKRCSPTS